MSLIGDRCYFCLNRAAEVAIQDESAELRLCRYCHKQYMECAQNDDKSPLELPRKDPSELCVKCGLCCIMLCARVDDQEAENLIEQANENNRYPQDMHLERFSTVQDQPPYKGDRTINMPCCYLQGAMLNYVQCRVYDLDRPKVCGSYLCKIAVEFRLGKISMPEAIFRLRSSFMNGDVSIFNWTQAGTEGSIDENEVYVSIMGQISDLIYQMRKDEYSEDQIELAVANRLTPMYVPSSIVGQAALNMHLYNVDRGDFNLDLYIPELVKGYTPDQKEAAQEVLEALLIDLRQLFIRTDECGSAPKEKSDDDGVQPETSDRDNTAEVVEGAEGDTGSDPRE